MHICAINLICHTHIVHISAMHKYGQDITLHIVSYRYHRSRYIIADKFSYCCIFKNYLIIKCMTFYFVGMTTSMVTVQGSLTLSSTFATKMATVRSHLLTNHLMLDITGGQYQIHIFLPDSWVTVISPADVNLFYDISISYNYIYIYISLYTLSRVEYLGTKELLKSSLKPIWDCLSIFMIICWI